MCSKQYIQKFELMMAIDEKRWEWDTNDCPKWHVNPSNSFKRHFTYNHKCLIIYIEYDSSSGDQKCLYKMSWQSLKHYLSLNQSGLQINLRIGFGFTIWKWINNVDYCLWKVKKNTTRLFVHLTNELFAIRTFMFCYTSLADGKRLEHEWHSVTDLCFNVRSLDFKWTTACLQVCVYEPCCSSSGSDSANQNWGQKQSVQ